MSGIAFIHEVLGSPVCLACVNRRLSLRLKPTDCLFSVYPQECRCCGEMHRAVEDLRFPGRLKLLLR